MPESHVRQWFSGKLFQNPESITQQAIAGIFQSSLRMAVLQEL
jgi:hypothetical protein